MTAQVDHELVQLWEVTWEHDVTVRGKRKAVTSRYRVAHRAGCRRRKALPRGGIGVEQLGVVPLDQVDAWLACAWCLADVVAAQTQQLERPAEPAAALPPVVADADLGLMVLDRPNRYPGVCARCRKPVRSMEGQPAERDDGWAVVHRQGACPS